MRSSVFNASLITAFILFVLIGTHSTDAFGQGKTGHKMGSKEFCSNNYYGSDNRTGFSEVREFTLPATGRLSVDGGKNGGISVKAAAVSEIQVKACVNTWAETADAARSAAAAIRISNSGTIKADGPEENSHWSVSYLITVPRNTNLDLSAKNGGISIAGVEGDLNFETVNGGLGLKDLAGNVRGRTVNGGISLELSGNSFNGSGLDVTTTNGGVHLSIPQNFAANIETGTVNGGFKSDVPELNVTTEDVKGDWGGGSRAKQINTAINGGGAPIRLKTTNGGVKISVSDETKL